MATRLRFPVDTPATVNPVASGTWDNVASAVNLQMAPGALFSPAGNSSALAFTAGQRALAGRFLSAPLRGNQTISGSVKCYIQAKESAADDNAVAQLEIYVVSGDGLTVRGTCLTIGDYSTGTEIFNTSFRNKRYADGDALTSVNALDGDRLVVALGFADASGTTPSAQLGLGDKGAGNNLQADGGENEIDNTVSGWVEFSQNLSFWGTALTRQDATPAVTASSATTASKTPTAGELQIVIVYSVAASGTVSNIPTISTTTGLTFAQVAAIVTGATSKYRITVFTARGTPSGAGTVTADFAGQSQVGLTIDWLEYPGVDVTNPIVQIVSNSGASNSLTINLAAPASPDNVIMAAFGIAGNPTWTRRTGWGEIDRQGVGAYSHATYYRPNAEATASAGFSISVTNLGLAMELNVAEPPPPAATGPSGPLPYSGGPTSRTTLDDLTALLNRGSHRLCYVVLFEGVGMAFTTTEDLAGISAAWAGSQWDTTLASWFRTAFYPGTFKQEIEFFDPKIPSDSISFMVLDESDAVAGVIFGQNRQAARTYLTADMQPSDTALVAQETGGFAGLGSAYDLFIGTETIGALEANRSVTGWTSLTRAKFHFHATSTGAPFASRHTINKINSAGPRVTSSAVTWYNRRVRIFLHHFEIGLGWSHYDQALLVWEGMLRNIVDDGDRTLKFNAIAVTESLKTNLFEDQFTAEVGEGVYLPPQALRLNVIETFDPNTGASGVPWLEPSIVQYTATMFGGSAGFYTAQAIMDSINAALVPSVSGLQLMWSIGRGHDGHVTVSIATAVGFTATDRMGLKTTNFMALDPRVWNLLGFGYEGSSGTEHAQSAVYNLYKRVVNTMTWLDTANVYHWILVAAETPIVTDLSNLNNDKTQDQRIRIQNPQGEWAPQAVFAIGESIAPTTEGYIQIGDLTVKAVAYDAVASVMTVTDDINDQFSSLGFGGNRDQLGIIREADDPFPIAVKQIWFERAAVKDILLRLLLSTGDAGYNEPSYDVNPVGMGVGVPYDLLDLKTFLSLGPETFTLLVTKPTQFSEVFRSMAATHGRHLVYRRGLLSLVQPHVDGPSIAVAYLLTNDNKASVDDRARAELATDGVINKVELKFQRAYDGSFKSHAVFEDSVSVSDFGPRKSIAIEGQGIGNDSDGLAAFEKLVAAMALAFFSRPMTIVERTINKSMVQIAPGDTVLLSDPYLISPKTGRRGLVNWPAWVRSVSFDFADMKGQVELVYNGEMDVDKICPWAPSARIDEAATNAGYVVVDGSTRYLKIKPTAYLGEPGIANDAYYFDAGDKVIVRELSPADARAPQIIHAVLASVDLANARLYLTATIAGWDTTKRYIVTPDVIGTVQQSQLAGTFIADDATDTTSRLPNDSYIWGSQTPIGTTAAPITNQPYAKPPFGGYVDGQSYPLAVADIYDAFLSANSMDAFRTRHIGPCQIQTSERNTTQAIRELLAGPFWVPLYGGGRALKVRLRVRVASLGSPTVTFYVVSSKSMPAGSDVAHQVIYNDAVRGEVSGTTSSPTFVWLGPLTLPVYPVGGAPPGVWVTVEAFTGSASDLAVISGISTLEFPG